MSALHSNLFPTETPHFEPVQSVSTFTVRILNANDSNAFRAIRLEALRTEGPLFGPTYEVEEKLPPVEWSERCTETKDRCAFGLFENRPQVNGAELIGIMSARTWEEDPKRETVLWGQTYLKPEYRGMKLAASLYECRKSWSIKNQFKRAIFFIRQDNKRSLAIHEKQGAEFLYTKLMQWPGRPIAPWRWYQQKLNS